MLQKNILISPRIRQYVNSTVFVVRYISKCTMLDVSVSYKIRYCLNSCAILNPTNYNFVTFQNKSDYVHRFFFQD